MTKPDERGNMKRAQVVELIDQFDDALDKDQLRYKFRVEFKKKKREDINKSHRGD